MSRIACLWIITCLSSGLGAAQTPKAAPFSTPPDIAALVTSNRTSEAVQAAVQSPGSVEPGIQKLCATFDLLVNFRQLQQAGSVLDASEHFLDELEKSSPAVKVSRDPIRGRRLRLAGIELGDQKQYREAETKLREALAISVAARDAVLEAGVHNNLGYALHYQNRMEEAAAEYDRARQMAEEQNDSLRAGSYNFNLGQALLALQKPESAAEAFRRAEAQNSAAGRGSLEARSVIMRGIALARVNPQSPAAFQLYGKARTMFQDQGDDRNVGWALFLMAGHRNAEAQFLEAARYAEEAVPYLIKSDDKALLRNCYTLLSSVYSAASDSEKAEHYKRLAQSLPPEVK